MNGPLDYVKLSIIVQRLLKGGAETKGDLYLTAVRELTNNPNYEFAEGERNYVKTLMYTAIYSDNSRFYRRGQVTQPVHIVELDLSEAEAKVLATLRNKSK